MEEERPALVLTGLMMSDPDSGFWLRRHMKQDPRLGDVLIIIATAVSGQCGLDFRPRSSEGLGVMGTDARFDEPARPRPVLEKAAQLPSPGTEGA
jgi:CheY-like chemotaxis protein